MSVKNNANNSTLTRSKLMMMKSKTSHELQHQNENKPHVVDEVVNMSVNNGSFLSAKNDSFNMSSIQETKKRSNNNILKTSFSNNPNNMSISNDNLTFSNQNLNVKKASFELMGKKEEIDSTYYSSSVLKNNRISASKLLFSS